MTQARKNIIATVLISGFLLSSLFGCVWALQNFSIPHNDHHTRAMACCDDNIVLLGMGHETSFLLSENDPYQLLFLLIVILYAFIRKDKLDYDSRLINYFKSRYRYGEFKLWHHFVGLFSRGILHPKIY